MWVKKNPLPGMKTEGDYINLSAAHSLGLHGSRSFGWSVAVSFGPGSTAYLGEFKDEKKADAYRKELLEQMGVKIVSEPASEVES